MTPRRFNTVPAVIHILLIEDSPLDASLLKESLAETDSFDFDLREVASMVAAEGYLAVEPFDVILLDLRSPDSEPSESYDRAKAAAGGIPVLVVAPHCGADSSDGITGTGDPAPFLKGTMKRADLVAAIKNVTCRNAWRN